MFSTTEKIKQDIEQLSPEDVQAVADFMAVLKFSDRRGLASLELNKLALLQTEFVDEDRAFAELGMSDYRVGLDIEDHE